MIRHSLKKMAAKYAAGFIIVLAAFTGQAQAAPFIYYPSENPSAVGTAMAGTPTTFDASATAGSSYVWRFRGCTTGTCPTGKIVTWTYPDPGRTYVMLTVDGNTFPTIAVDVQQAMFSVSVTPSEGGNVTAGAGTGAGIACGIGEETQCQETYLDNVGVLLHAEPHPEWRTSHWIVNTRTIMTDMPLMLKGDGPYAVQAVFTPKKLSITSTPPPMRGPWYKYDVDTIGGRGEPEFTILKGPSGMTIGTASDYGHTLTGMLEWEAAPEQIGTHEVVVQAEDDDGQTAEQTFTLTVTDAVFDQADPVVTLAFEPEVMLLGESVVITSTAADNIGVLDFALIINEQKVSTSPGTFTYTPPETGRYRVVVIAQDAGGNTDLKRASFWVKDVSAAIKLYEGFDAERGFSQSDATLMTFTSAPMTDTTTIPLPPGVTRLVTFGPSADVHFEAANGLRLVLEPGVTGVLLPDTNYAGVTAETLSTVSLTAWPDGQPVTETDTVVLKTADGTVFKFGNMTVNPEAWTVNVSYEAIQ